MLGAKGRYITARDASGKILATMVTTTHGEVLDAQITADHKTIFYRVTDDTAPCDKIARADIDGRTSSFVARGDVFAISRRRYAAWRWPASVISPRAGVPTAGRPRWP